MSTRIALQVNALVGLAAAAVAGAIMSLVFTSPEVVASALAQRDVVAMASAVAQEVVAWIQAILRFL